MTRGIEAESDVIRVNGLHKRFRRYEQRQRRSLKEILLHPFKYSQQQKNAQHYFEVLHDISFRVEQGTTVGIIGRNGSGKTTLLRLICGIYRADSGTIETRGRLSALLGLGVGFHPELTGRENILINGLILGLSRAEIQRKFDSIVDFAELSEFIDAPIRTYSSGMHARLGFSIAVNTDPDVLLLDEVLAVGDANFQEKCRRRMNDYRRNGKTILIVTHDLGVAESWCDRLLLLHRGMLVASGVPAEVLAKYRDLLSQDQN